MRILEGTPEEIAAFMKSTGTSATTIVNTAGNAGFAGSAVDSISEFVRRRVHGNEEKQRLVERYLDGVTSDSTLRVRVATKGDGNENDYLTGRLTTVDEDRIGNVIYCRPSSSTLWLRLPAASVEGYHYAKRIDSKKSAEEFARVRHQVILKLANDDAVAEGVKLTKLAIEKALNDDW